MSEATPIERLRRAGLHDALLDLLGIDEDVALREIEPFLAWVEIPRGARLYRQGDAADDLHIVVSGRLRAITEDARGRLAVAGEISRGQTVGEMALLSGRTRAASVHAIRDSVLLRVDRGALEALVARSPRLALNISRLVSDRLRRSLAGQEAPRRWRSVAIVPHGRIEDAAAFARRLAAALATMGSVALVDAAADAASPAGGADDLARKGALDAIELANDCVLYLSDLEPTPWAHACLRRADAVLVVAPFASAAAPGPCERWLDGESDPRLGPGRALVLLHADGAEPPRGTARWLAGRRLDRHHHVRLDRDGDVARVARWIAGRAVGLVLAGGGAPGFAHVGTVRALREAGVPIDAVAGTSIGSIVAAAVALDFDDARLAREMREAFVGSNPLGDYRLVPMISLSKGRRMEQRLRRHLGEDDIEDTWLPFFCVSADISRNEQHVHATGSLWRAVRTSASVPGVLPPVVHGNRLLIDGSAVNNLPVDLMREAGAGRIVAADLDLRIERDLGYDEIPPPWRVLAGRFVPGFKRMPVPGLVNVVMKSTMIAGQERAARARDAVDLYLAPSVARIGLLRWDAFDKVADIGYRYAVNALDPGTVARLTGSPP